MNLEILQHALGLDQYGRGAEYRNRFVTGPGCRDFDDCRALCEAGLMHDRGPGGELTGGDHSFFVTDAGRRRVREHSPPAPKLTRSQQRYRDFLDHDSGMSFGEWLRYDWSDRHAL